MTRSTLLSVGRVRGRAFLPVVLVLAGCQMPEMRVPFFSARRAEEERRMTSIANIRGPLERVLPASAAGRAEQASLQPAAGLEEYQRAEELYKAGQVSKAGKDFRRIAKKYKGSQVEEDALFMVGECQFEQKQFARAQDSYDRLLRDFPSSRHLDRVTRRMFLVAQAWLEFPQVVESSEIQTVDYQKPRATPPPAPPHERSLDPSRRVPIFPNLWNRSRPVFDTDGRALQALKAIWLNDPTGPLADDALMLTASHHLRRGNYMEAARTYEMLLDQYPKSEHLKDAFVLCAHATAMSHQGPLYDGQSLERSRELKQSAIRLFPDAVDRERILDEIRRIDDERARSEWANVEFWRKKNDPVAIASCCREVIRLYPNSTYAAQARELLKTIEADQARKASGGEPRFFWQRGGEYEEPRLLPAAPAAAPDDLPGRASL